VRSELAQLTKVGLSLRAVRKARQQHFQALGLEVPTLNQEAAQYRQSQAAKEVKREQKSLLLPPR
jgi:hypothetical protein